MVRSCHDASGSGGDGHAAEEAWPGGVVVDDGGAVSEEELAAAVATYESGNPLTGREMRAVVTQVC